MRRNVLTYMYSWMASLAKTLEISWEAMEVVHGVARSVRTVMTLLVTDTGDGLCSKNSFSMGIN